MLELAFTFTEKCWLWTAENQVSWHFVNVPKNHSEEIKFFTENHFGKRRGWGSVRVTVTIGSSEWKTSIFPSKSLDAYLLPIKADVRKKEKILVDNMVEVTLNIKV
jgi:Domain of unknown function (DUF1905)